MGVFKCDGDLLWCPAKGCPMQFEDMSGMGRPGLYTHLSNSEDKCDEKKKKKKKKKRRLLRQVERAVKPKERNGEGEKQIRRLFNSRRKFVYESVDTDDEKLEEERVGPLGRMLGKKKKKKESLKGREGLFSKIGGFSFGRGGVSFKKDSKKKCKKKKKKSPENGVCTTTCRCGDVNEVDDDVFEAFGNINKMRRIEGKDLNLKKKRR